MRVCPNHDCPHRKLTGERAAFESDREHCSDCDATLVASDEEAVEERPPPPAKPTGLVRRALVTLGVMAAIEVARETPSPFLSPEHFMGDGTFEVIRDVSTVNQATASAISAFVTVEAVSILIPALRRRRHDHPKTRQRMTMVAWALTMFMTLSQGYAYAQYGMSHGMSEGVDLPFTASFLAGPIALWAAVRVLDRWGIGGGWPMVLIGSSAAPLVVDLASLVRQQVITPAGLALHLCLYAGWAALGWRFLRRRFERDAEAATADLGPSAYRSEATTATTLRLRFRAPLWGTVPLAAAVAIFTIFQQLRDLHTPGAAGLIETLNGNPWLHTGCCSLVALGMLALLPRLPTSLRHADQRLAALGMRSGVSSAEAIARAAKATRAMMLAGCVLILLGDIANLPRFGPMTGLTTLAVTALALDLVDEWRAFSRHGALTPVLREQRVWLADATASLLEREGVPAFVRSANYHQIAWWGAPQAPAVVMVPVDRRDEALAIIEPADEAPTDEAPTGEASP